MIKLSEIRDALYDVSMGTSCYFNTKTNEILWYWDFNKEESTYTEKDEFNDDIISMFNFYSKNDYDIIVANGQNDLKDKIFRIGTLGFVSERDILAVLASLNAVIKKLKV